MRFVPNDKDNLNSENRDSISPINIVTIKISIYNFNIFFFFFHQTENLYPKHNHETYYQSEKSIFENPITGFKDDSMEVYEFEFSKIEISGYEIVKQKKETVIVK